MAKFAFILTVMGVKISESLNCSLWSVGSLQPSLLLKAWLVVVSEQVAQGFIQLGFEIFQEWKLDRPGKPALLLGIKGFPCIQSELFLFWFDHCLLSCPHCKEPDFVPWELPCKVSGTAVRFPKDIFAPGWKAQLLHVICTGQVPSWWSCPGHAQEMFSDVWLWGLITSF